MNAGLAVGADFDGSTYCAQFDKARLTGQVLRTFDLMRDGRWRTLDEISSGTGDPPASVSARLRDLRKEKFGGHAVERRSVSGRCHGLFEYQLRVSPVSAA